jgi:hypothetical protein
MSEGSDSVPLLMALLFSAKVLVEYRANLVSDFDPNASCFEEQCIYCCFEVHRLCLVKNLTPLWATPMIKRVRTLKSKCVMLLSMMKVRLYFTKPLLLQIGLNEKTMKAISIPGML